METHFIEPLDVLFLRDNRLFGAPGTYGESLLPPWPSVAAGALRSLVYAEDGRVLTDPEDFRLLDFQLARQTASGVEALHFAPADLVVSGKGEHLHVDRLHPEALHEGIQSSSPLPKLPVLAQAERSKPSAGWWLSGAGWHRYLHGEALSGNEMVASTELWQMQHRVGVGLDADKRRAADGKLFSMQAIAFRPGVGFLAGHTGQVSIPATGILRLGGDGRGAAMSCIESPVPVVDHAALVVAGRIRIVLTTPGIFPDGWRLPGMREDGHWECGGIQARVVAAAVPRAETVSGWDLAKKMPKDAFRVAPAGSVYWLENVSATTEALDKLAARGLWGDQAHDVSRRVEGFNRFTFAAY